MHLFKPQKKNIEAVFLQYGDMLYRVALTRLGNDADAQDVVQDVFLKFMVSEPEFKDGEHEKAWFLRALINKCNDFMRRQKHRDFLPIENAHHIATDNNDRYNDLLSLISQLPPIYKDTVILHSLEGFSLEETANILGISLSAAKMRLSRAREILQILKKEENDVY